MGRSITFDYNIHLPTEIYKISDILKKLDVGNVVYNLSFCEGIKDETYVRPRLLRSASNYGYETSPINNKTTYIVDETNFDPQLLHRTGLNAITIRDVTINKNNHLATWLITTDGYIRESEEYGIIGYIKNISTLNLNTGYNDVFHNN